MSPRCPEKVRAQAGRALRHPQLGQQTQSGNSLRPFPASPSQHKHSLWNSAGWCTFPFSKAFSGPAVVAGLSPENKSLGHHLQSGPREKAWAAGVTESRAQGSSQQLRQEMLDSFSCQGIMEKERAMGTPGGGGGRGGGAPGPHPGHQEAPSLICKLPGPSLRCLSVFS